MESSLNEEGRKLLHEILAKGSAFRIRFAERMAEQKKLSSAAEERFRMQRQALYSNNAVNVRETLARLREESARASSSPGEDEWIREGMEEVRNLLVRLESMVPPGVTLPWRLRYVCEVDPSDDSEPLQLGGRVVGADGRSIWSDYCALCWIEMEDSVPRLRCMHCEDVWCCDCVNAGFVAHHNRDCHGGSVICNPVFENVHAVSLRVHVPINKTLAAMLLACFEVYHQRPCLGPAAGPFLSYREIGQRSVRLAAYFLEKRFASVAICLHNCVEWYITDFACVLAGATSVGIFSSLDVASIANRCNVLVATEQILASLRNDGKLSCATLPVSGREWVEALNTMEIEFDVVDDDSLAPYTHFYTSGSTGSPKGVAVSRRAFRVDCCVSSGHHAPPVYASFLPSAWGADRLSCYQTLYNGGRVGFCRPDFDALFVDTAHLQPTFFFGPPLVFQFLNQFDDATVLSSLGVRIRVLGSGGGALEGAIVDRFKSIFQCEFAIGYGITEVGGVTSNGRILPGVEVRFADPVDLRPNGDQVGRLLVKTATTMAEGYVDGAGEISRAQRFDSEGFFDTGDICILSACGRNLKVIGRAELSAIKLKNGLWWSADSVESTVLDLAKQVMAHVFVDWGDDVVLVVHGSRASVEELCARSGARAVVVAEEPLPFTATQKLNRLKTLQLFEPKMRGALTAARSNPHAALSTPKESKALAIARQLLPNIDVSRSFLENGANSFAIARFVHLMGGGGTADWRTLLHSPLQELVEETTPNSFTASMDNDLEKFAVFPQASTIMQRTEPGAMLVTGATGFCGAHFLLHAISNSGGERTIFCLVRQADGSKALLDALSKYGGLLKSLPPHVIALRGSLEEPQLGLSRDDWNMLEHSVDVVWHFGARVDFRDTYASARGANVLGTHALATFCSSVVPPRHFVYVSTQSAVRNDGINDGYANSKFVGECIARAAGASIVRLPLVLFSFKTGIGNATDWLSRLVVTCIKLRAFPRTQALVPCVTADELTESRLAGGENWAVLSLGWFLEQVAALLGANVRFCTMPEFHHMVRLNPQLPAFPVLQILPRNDTAQPAVSGRTLLLTSEQIKANVAFLISAFTLEHTFGETT